MKFSLVLFFLPIFLFSQKIEPGIYCTKVNKNIPFGSQLCYEFKIVEFKEAFINDILSYSYGKFFIEHHHLTLISQEEGKEAKEQFKIIRINPQKIILKNLRYSHRLKLFRSAKSEHSEIFRKFEPF